MKREAIVELDRAHVWHPYTAMEQYRAETDPLVLANLFVSYRDLGVKGLEAGIGIYNALGDKNYFFQPYDGGHAEMRGGDRQLLLRVGFTQPL